MVDCGGWYLLVLRLGNDGEGAEEARDVEEVHDPLEVQRLVVLVEPVVEGVPHLGGGAVEGQWKGGGGVVEE